MPAAYSHDLRERVVDTVEAGRSRRRAAGIFRVSVSTAVRWMQRVAETGSCAARPTGGDHKSGAIEVHKDWPLAQAGRDAGGDRIPVAEHPRSHEKRVLPVAIFRPSRRHFQKKRSSPPNRTGRT